MIEAVIVDAVRTPIGRALKGSLRAMRADELAAVRLRALIERNPAVDFAETCDVMMGAASGTGEQGYNVGRNALLLAGIDDRVPGCTVNRFCASSLQTLRMAFHAIAPGEGEQYIAAGVESVSRAGLGAAPDHDDADQRPRDDRRAPGDRRGLRRRRDGSGDAGGTDLSTRIRRPRGGQREREPVVLVGVPSRQHKSGR